LKNLSSYFGIQLPRDSALDGFPTCSHLTESLKKSPTSSPLLLACRYRRWWKVQHREGSTCVAQSQHLLQLIARLVYMFSVIEFIAGHRINRLTGLPVRFSICMCPGGLAGESRAAAAMRKASCVRNIILSRYLSAPLESPVKVLSCHAVKRPEQLPASVSTPIRTIPHRVAKRFRDRAALEPCQWTM
jgi:hypothetical protein